MKEVRPIIIWVESMRKTVVSISTLGIACLIGGCASMSDAPPSVTSVMDSWGISLSHFHSGTIESYSTVHSQPNTTGFIWTNQTLTANSTIIAQKCYQASCWQVRSVTPNTRNDCASNVWDASMETMLRTEKYLLGGKTPTPMTFSIFLIPSNDAYSDKFVAAKTDVIPLTFVFHYTQENLCSPTTALGAGSRIADIVSMIAYEAQHISYALTGARNPASTWSAPQLVKNEANSQCWKYSVSSVLAWHTNTVVTIPSPGDEAMWLVEHLGHDPRNAAIVGPLLINWQLGKIVRRQAVGDANETSINAEVINGHEKKDIQRLLRYCRWFTAYNGNVLKARPTAGPVTTPAEPDLNKLSDRRSGSEWAQ